jgi:hypothetical protein
MIFGLVCLAHLVRLFLPFSVMVGSHAVPVWLSAAGFIVTGLLAFWLWMLSLPTAAQPAAEAPPPARA